MTNNIVNQNITEYSLEDVNAHNKEDNVWMVIKGLVYDLTEYLDEHPGGDVLLDAAGADGTEQYISIGHSPEADEQLKEYLIGRLSSD